MKPVTIQAILNGDISNAIISATPGGIEAQEAQGQKDLVNSSNIPREFNGCTQADFLKLGFQFFDDVDDLFVDVAMPDGWEVQPTDHSMWSKIVDEKGRERASMFYKAAFYDRSAHISLTRRFSAGYMPEDDYKTKISYEERDQGNWSGS